MPKVKVTHIEKLLFKAENESKLSSILEASAAHGGGTTGLTPMEHILAALGGCSGMDVVSLLKNKHQDVTGYEINISGEQAEDYPKIYTKINVEHIIKGKNIDESAVKWAIQESHSKYCSVNAMLKETAEIEVSYKIINE
ncbi:MAG: OsmC family protein [Armatimonadota bacterium]